MVTGGCRLREGVLGEQLPGNEDFHPAVWVRTQRKMAAGLITVLFFLFFITQAWASEVVGAVHGVVYLSPSKHNGYSQVHWRWNDTVKIASQKNGEAVQYPNGNYKGRLKLFPNKTLMISHLQKSDSGKYQVYLEDYNGKEHIENILLVVYDLVPKPTVKAEVIEGDLKLCKTILECSVDLEGVTYEWINPSKILPDNDTGAFKQLVSYPSVETYICKVSNRVSSNNASLTYRHPCSWTGDSSAASSCTTISMRMVLGHLLLLLFLLTLA